MTATAAIDTGKYTPNSLVNGDSPKTISGVPLQNDNNQSFGPITLTKALTNSVNTVWAQVAQNVGRPTMTKYMKRFGFYAQAADRPARRRAAHEPPLRLQGPGRIRPASPNEDIGRIGIGQGGLVVTPLQMAMVAAAVANGGKLMEPQLGHEGGRSRRAHRQDDQSDGLPPGDERQDGRRGQPDDAHRGRRGHRHPRPAGLRDPVRRQDRHRVDRDHRRRARPSRGSSASLPPTTPRSRSR